MSKPTGTTSAQGTELQVVGVKTPLPYTSSRRHPTWENQPYQNSSGRPALSLAHPWRPMAPRNAHREKPSWQKILAEIVYGYSTIVDEPGPFFIEDRLEPHVLADLLHPRSAFRGVAE
jgi:hypothetical protein